MTPSSRVLVVCEDAGAAAGIAPVAARLRDRDGLRGIVIGGASKAEFERWGLPNRVVSDARAVQAAVDDADAHDIVLTGSSPWGARLEAHAVLAARHRSLRVVTFVDYWSNYRPRLSFPGDSGLELVPDRLVVVDERMKREVVALGVDGSRVVATGSPAFDRLWSRRDPTPGAGEGALFLSQPIEALYGTTLGYTEKTTLAALAPRLSRSRTRLVVRPHPREDRDALASFVAGLPCDARIETDGDVEDAILRARVVVGMTTMGLVMAALLGRPTASFQLGVSEPLELPTIGLGATKLATAEETIDAVWSDLLDGPGAAPRFSDEAWRPGATERLLELLTAGD